MDTNVVMNVLKVVKDGNQSELNHIPSEAREDVLGFCKKEGLLDGLTKTKDGYVGNPKITLRGLEFYESNKKSTKFYNTLKEIRDWIPGY